MQHEINGMKYVNMGQIILHYSNFSVCQYNQKPSLNQSGEMKKTN